MSYEDRPQSSSDSSPNPYDNLILDSGSQRLLDLTSPPPSQRSPEAIEEILVILQRKARKLIDGLAEHNKVELAKHCQLKLYMRDDEVFLQGDEPDAYYTVMRGAVSIYALNSSFAKSADSNDHGGRRDNYGLFLVQVPPGESFGELSFNENGVHDRRNASVVSDGAHGQARLNKRCASTLAEIEASDVCILLKIPEQIYMSEMFARHSSKHQTKDKISFLKKSILFEHWTMDQLIKMAYAMKKRQYEKGSVIIRQGERMEYCWLIKEGAVRISHRVNASQGRKSVRQSRTSYVDERNEAAEQSLIVDVADLGSPDCIGLVESMDDNARKSQRDAVALSSTTELFFLPMTFFRSMISQDVKTLSIIEKVVHRRKKWEYIRREYAIKFPTMSMRLPKGAVTLAQYAIRTDIPNSKSKKKRGGKPEKSRPSRGPMCVEEDSSGRGTAKGHMRKNRENALDLLVKDAGVVETTI